MAGIEQVIAEYSPALGRIAASYERDRALREELVQDILFAIHQALPSLADDGKLRPFIFRIAHNRAVSHVMRRVREKTPVDFGDAGDALPDPEQQWAQRQRAERLIKAVRRLPLPYRQVITLLLEDLSYEEIADVLGLSVSNVGVRINRAKEQLKAMLCDE